MLSFFFFSFFFSLFDKHIRNGQALMIELSLRQALFLGSYQTHIFHNMKNCDPVTYTILYQGNIRPSGLTRLMPALGGSPRVISITYTIFCISYDPPTAAICPYL